MCSFFVCLILIRPAPLKCKYSWDCRRSLPSCTQTSLMRRRRQRNSPSISWRNFHSEYLGFVYYRISGKRICFLPSAGDFLPDCRYSVNKEPVGKQFGFGPSFLTGFNRVVVSDMNPDRLYPNPDPKIWWIRIQVSKFTKLISIF